METTRRQPPTESLFVTGDAINESVHTSYGCMYTGTNAFIDLLDSVPPFCFRRERCGTFCVKARGPNFHYEPLPIFSFSFFRSLSFVFVLRDDVEMRNKNVYCVAFFEWLLQTTEGINNEFYQRTGFNIISGTQSVKILRLTFK